LERGGLQTVFREEGGVVLREVAGGLSSYRPEGFQTNFVEKGERFPYYLRGVTVEKEHREVSSWLKNFRGNGILSS